MAEPELVASDSASPPSPPPEDNLSLADHEARYGEGAQHAQPEAATPPAELPQTEPDTADTGTPETEDAAGPRDERGRFLPKKRHRAESAIATSEDVPRIQQLTARLRAAEAERDALKARTSESVAPIPRAVPPPPVAATPKPTPDQFTDYSEYVEALSDWKTDQKIAAWETKHQEAEQARAAEFDRQRLTKSWTERVTAAKAKYPDFEEVALQSDTSIPQGSLIDAWILEDETGADVLYYLQQHPDEVQTILNQSVLQQAKSLALLAQRFNGSSSRTAAVATGSAPAPPSTPTPRPPNPVRTGPLRTGDEPPDEEVASLADHEKWYAMRRRRGG